MMPPFNLETRPDCPVCGIGFYLPSDVCDHCNVGRHSPTAVKANSAPPQKQTVFSACRRWRYTLWRSWPIQEMVNLRSYMDSFELFGGNNTDFNYVQFIGLNPSTADETKDDPTVRRCIQFAKDWGFGALCMTNAFAWRSTDPEKMKEQKNPIGEKLQDEEVGANWQRNDIWLTHTANHAGLVVAAWGKHGTHLGRDDAIIEMIPRLHCLGVNSDGTPKHPLYLPSITQPVPYKKIVTS